MNMYEDKGCDIFAMCYCDLGVPLMRFKAVAGGSKVSREKF